MENAKTFSIYTSLPEVVNIYNKNKHSTTKFAPEILFKTTDINIINIALENIKKSQKKI